MEIAVIKVGGAVVEDEKSLSTLLDSFVGIKTPKVLVHGGGRTASKISKSLGIEPQMIDGRRVTDADTIGVVTMVYAGLVGKNIAAKLQARGCNAISLSGADMNVICSAKRPPIKVASGETVDFGFVGDVKSVDADMLISLISAGVTPVICPITHDGQGNLLNTNADTIATQVAIALAARSADDTVRLTYCFEKAGVLRDADDDASVIGTMTHAEFKALQADGTVSAGMIPKLDNGFEALRSGVSAVRITNTDGLSTLTGTNLAL
ncbi:MAG: acetylglutamate kinase [Bacteroidales bacterium]|nr:acetylglutamate kinase [Bacteroidales bacterium]